MSVSRKKKIIKKSKKNKANAKSKVIKKVVRRQKNSKTIINDGYERPAVTPTELLTADDIRQRMKNYNRVSEDDIFDLVDGDKIRYFEVIENGKFKYKPGGFVLVNGAPDYLVLTTPRKSWSVQLKNHIIFKEKDINKIEEAHQNEINEIKKNERHLYGLIVRQKKRIALLERKLAKLQNNKI